LEFIVESFEQYYDTYALDASGKTMQDYSRFEGGIYGAPGKNYANNIGFSLSWFILISSIIIYLIIWGLFSNLHIMHMSFFYPSIRNSDKLCIFMQFIYSI
jgi:hypothetical protein